MQRRPYVAGAALAAMLLAAGLTGCTGDEEAGSPQDSKPGGPAATEPAAEPGRYRTLPEPCGAVGRGTLRALLPGVDALEGQEREKAYDGQAAITFDTDRRVGCRWKADSPAGSRHLSIDLERVVSYERSLSDDDRAQELYGKKATAAGIPALNSAEDEDDKSSDSASASATESAARLADQDGADDKGGKQGKGVNEVKGDSADHGKDMDQGLDGSGTPSDSAGTAPRPLDDLADAAYLDDRLVTADSGVHRDITLVFRVANVLVTVEYDQWSAVQADVPDSQDLQSKAQRLARELADTFSE
ncbi:hypothetical protein ACTWQI_23135 [Streptomyces sp. KR80]